MRQRIPKLRCLLITAFFETYFAAEDAVDIVAIGEDKGDADSDDDEENFEGEGRGGCVVDGQAVGVGVDAGADHRGKSADGK